MVSRGSDREAKSEIASTRTFEKKKAFIFIFYFISTFLPMPADVHMLNALPPDIPRPFPASTSVSSAAPTRHSSLAALMNPEPVPVIDVSDDEESEAEAEMAAAVDDCDDDVEDEDEGSEEEEEEEEEEDSGKESILIAETHGPSATSEPTAAVAAILHPASFLPPASAAVAAVPGGPALIPAVSASAPPLKPASTAKPRSKKPRSPSPSPPPLQPPLPLTTIRLQIRLGGPDNYQVDVSKMAKDTGQRAPTPPPRVKHPISESEQEPETDGGKKKKRRVCIAFFYLE